ncbi:MAG TPA: DoxX family protein [Nocardioidaceae bacterium]|nr:DoxX family protein [Nocardioidaceae bacterium]
MTLVRLLARPMLASMFVVGGYNAYKNAESMAKKAQPVTDRVVPKAQKLAPSAPIPTDSVTLVKINAATQVGAGLMLATGKFPRLSADVLALTMVPTTAAGHPFWEEKDSSARANQIVHFFKNVSMMGGLLLAGVDTEGKPGMAWRTRNAAKTARRETKYAKRGAKLAGKSAGKSAGRVAKG